LAGARAAASLSLTIGVAFATVLVVSGILAAPSIIDCSRQGGSMGACLRDKIQHGALQPAEIAPPASSLSSAAAPLSSEAAPPAATPVTVTPIPVVTPHDDGWIDARANEYDPVPPPQPVIDGALGGEPQVTASAQLAPAPVIALPAADGEVGRQPRANGSAALVAAASDPAQPEVSGDIGPRSEANASATLLAQSGETTQSPPEAEGDIGHQPRANGSAALVADVSEPERAPRAAGGEIVPRPTPDVSAPVSLAGRGWATPAGYPVGTALPLTITGSIGPSRPATTSATLVAATPVPAPPSHPPVVAQRPRADVKPRPVTAPKGPPRYLPARKPPRHIFKNDPRFPNVTVLPAPATGADSSFVTLPTR